MVVWLRTQGGTDNDNLNEYWSGFSKTGEEETDQGRVEMK